MANIQTKWRAQTKLGAAFAVAVSAGESAIRVDTDEISDAIAAISEVCIRFEWDLRVFDPAKGVEWLQGKPQAKLANGAKSNSVLDAINGNATVGPTTGLEMLKDFWSEPAIPETAPKARGEVRPTVVIIKNLHLVFEGRREVAAAIVQHLVADKVCAHPNYKTLKENVYDPYGIEPSSDTGKFLVGLMPTEAVIPPEVSPLFRLITHELPDEAELRSVYKQTVGSVDDVDEDGDAIEDDMDLSVMAARGLTRQQAEGVYASSIVMHSRIVPSYVWAEKSKILNKEGLVELYAGKEKFSDVSGLDGAKTFLKQILTPSEYDIADPDVRAKGATFVGPPGVGKSLIAKAVGNELGWPILLVDPGRWMGQYVGQSEAKTRKGLQILRAHAPCIAIVDEAEKVLPKSGSMDSGVSGRMEGAFLTAMNDSVERIFWVFTANDVTKMHEAFLRAERVDGVFYVHLPDSKQRASLWKLYGKKFFPKETLVDGKLVRFPGHRSTDFSAVLAELKAAPKKDIDNDAWAERFTLPLLCLPNAERKTALASLKAVNPDVRAAVKLVTDKNWSPAEIRACCRLARLQDKPLAQTQKQIRPVSLSAKGVIDNLEEWAKESALDAETGETYTPIEDPEEFKENETLQAESSIKVRRKVRVMKDDSDS